MFKLDKNGQLNVEDFEIRTAGRYSYRFVAFRYWGVCICASFTWTENGKSIGSSIDIRHDDGKFQILLPYFYPGDIYGTYRLKDIGEHYGKYFQHPDRIEFNTIEDLNDTLRKFIEELSKM